MTECIDLKDNKKDKNPVMNNKYTQIYKNYKKWNCCMLDKERYKINIFQ